MPAKPEGPGAEPPSAPMPFGPFAAPEEGLPVPLPEGAMPAPFPAFGPEGGPIPLGPVAGGETIRLPGGDAPEGARPAELVSGDDALAAVLERDPAGWNPPPVPPETLESIRAAFAAWRESDRSEQATASLRIALSGLSRGETLAVAASLMRMGSEQDRMDALWTVASEFGATPGEEKTVRANADEEDGEASSEEDDEREAAETHDLVAIVGAALEDPSPDVQDLALETASVLSKEHSDVLYSQILCSDLEQTADLRRKLMSRLEGSSDPDAVNLFVQAMQSPDPETADAARKNLERISGRAIGSIEDALDWLDEQEESPSDPDGGVGGNP